MAEAKKEKKVKFVTPVGIAQYPRVNGKPDTKFRPEGVWGVKLGFTPTQPGVQEMVDRIEGVIAEAKKSAAADADYLKSLKKKGKKLTECDRSITVDEDTGEITVNFKMTASGVSKKNNEPWSRKPAVFAKDGTPMPADAKIGSGTKMQASYTLEPFYTALGYGCSIRLEAVRIVELVEWGGGDAESFGFENEEDEDEGADGGEAGDDDAGAGDAAEGSDDF